MLCDVIEHRSPALGRVPLPRTYLGLETLVPLSGCVPVVDILANLIFREAVPLLNLAFELVSTAIYNVKVVVSELSPLLLHPTFIIISFPAGAEPRRGSQYHLVQPYDTGLTRHRCERRTKKRPAVR